MARALSSLTLVAVFAAVLLSGAALGSAVKVAPLDQVSSNTLASGDFSLLLSMKHGDALHEHSLPALSKKLVEIAGSLPGALEVSADGADRVRVNGNGSQRRMAMALVGLALRRPVIRETLGVESAQVQGQVVVVAARRTFDAQNGNVTTTPAATPATTAMSNTTTAAPTTTAAAAATTTTTAATTTAAANTTAAPATPPPSTLPADFVAAITATIKIDGSAFQGLLTSNRAGLVTAVSRDLGTLLGVNASTIQITNMYIGSLVVEFAVSADAGVQPATLSANLALATAGTSWLASTQSVYSTVSSERLAVTTAPTINSAAPPGDITPVPPTTTAAPEDISASAGVTSVAAMFIAAVAVLAAF